MQKTRAQIQLQYHQTLNRICEMQILAEQLLRLAHSYRQEERGHPLTVREAGSTYAGCREEESPGDALQEQAEELKAAAEDWYRRARDEYRTSLIRVREAEECQKTW